jgi:DNA-binding transcriptional ArsR family regulator
MEPNERKIQLSSQDFKALSAENRVQILKLLRQRQSNPTELASKLNLSIPSCQKHLDKLLESGLIVRIEDNRKWAYYKLTPKGLALVEPENSRFLLLLAAGIVLFFGVLLAWNFPSNWVQPQIVLSPPIFDSETKTVQLSWTISPQLANSVFEIQRKTVSEKEFKTLQTGVKSTTYRDSQIEFNEHYEYRVLAQGTVSVPVMSNSIFVITTRSAEEETIPLSDQNNSPVHPPDANIPPDQNNPFFPPPDPSIPIPQNVQLFSIPSNATQWEQIVGSGEKTQTIQLEKTNSPAILLAWNMPKNENTLFEVQLQILGSEWTVLESGFSENFFLDTLTEIGETRFYRVRAWQNGSPSGFSAILSAQAS